MIEKTMNETKKSKQQESNADATVGVESIAVDLVGLADQLAQAREVLRTTYPHCFVDQPERCEAVTAAHQNLTEVENSLRSLAASTSLGSSEPPPPPSQGPSSHTDE
jgi:hypothetical protein